MTVLRRRPKFMRINDTRWNLASHLLRQASMKNVTPKISSKNFYRSRIFASKSKKTDWIDLLTFLSPTEQWPKLQVFPTDKRTKPPLGKFWRNHKKWFNDDNVFVWKHSTRKVTSFTGFDFYSSQIWTRDTGWGERFLPLFHACPPNTGIVLKRNKRIPLLLSVRKKSKTSSNLEEAIGNPIKNRGLIELAQCCGTHGY